MNQPDTPSDARTIAALGAAIGDARRADAPIDCRPYAVVPEGYRLQDLEPLLRNPMRRVGVVSVYDAASFIAVVKDQATAGTRLYRTVTPPRFVAVFNDHDHAGESPGWGDHRAVYTCPLSPEWSAWTTSNKRAMAQADFAQFIEDNLPDIADPPAAEMLEISRTLQAKKKVNFASALRLDNGQHQFTYEEQIDGKAGPRGQLRVPEAFTLGLAVFEGGARYALRARLRYRISDQGALSMWYDLERPHKIVEHAVEELRAAIEAATEMGTINGERA